MKNFKKILTKLCLTLLVVITIISSLPLYVLADVNQIVKEGGQTSENGVTVSKTIAKSNLENYFDITLKVTTSTELSEIEIDQDLSIVLVLDTSSSMTRCVDTNTTCAVENNNRINAAKRAIYEFTNLFYQYKEEADPGVKRELGLITFDTKARTKVDLVGDSNSETKASFDRIVRGISTSLGTNLEQALIAARNMLATSSVSTENKYIILLTDGYPTLHGAKATTSDIASNDYGNDDAIAAGEAGAANRAAHLKTFTIGVGLDGQRSYYNTSGYFEVGYDPRTYVSTCPGYTNNGRCYLRKSGNQYSAQLTIPGNYYITTPDHFKEWLGGHVSKNGVTTVGGIGNTEGMVDANGNPVKAYYDASNETELIRIYKDIFEKIKAEITKLSTAWQATDPMNSNINAEKIDFVGFYNSSNSIVSSLTGTNGRNNTNTASFANDSIKWDLRNSGYTTSKSGNTTYYTYTLKYKVRLENELNSFVQGDAYATNGKAYLHYTYEETGKDLQYGDIYFKVPEVKGFLGKLELTKVSNYDGTSLKGAKFELRHSDDCPCLNEKSHIDRNYKMTTVSGSDGGIVFNKIPSGHKYVLVEVEPPINHELNDTEYDIEINYGTATLDERIIDNKIKNDIDYGYLIVEKKLLDTHKSGEEEFSFELTTDSKLKTYSWVKTLVDKTTEKGTTTIEKVNTFTLKDGEQIKFKLPASSTYTVREVDDGKYIITTDDNVSGKIIQKDEVKTVIENETAPVDVKAEKIWKNTAGYLKLPSVTFTLYRKYKDETSWNEYDTKTLTSKTGWKYTWEDLDGEYEYMVDEVSVPAYFIKKVSFNEDTYTWEIENKSTLTYELPKTGSSEGLILLLMGISLMLTPFVYVGLNYKKSKGTL